MQSQYLKHPTVDKTLVFIHGWACVPNDFTFQIDYFKNSYSILLPNYSQAVSSDLPDNTNSIHWCASQINHCINQHRIQDLVLIGHRMGGGISLALTQELTARLSACILLDTSIPLNVDKKQVFIDLANKLRGHRATHTLEWFFDTIMFDTEYDNPTLMAHKRKEMIETCSQSFTAFASLLVDFSNFDALSALANLQAPSMYIGARKLATDFNILNRTSKGITTKQIFHSGHFLMLNAASELNKQLEVFLSPLKDNSIPH